MYLLFLKQNILRNNFRRLLQNYLYKSKRACRRFCRRLADFAFDKCTGYYIIGRYKMKEFLEAHKVLISMMTGFSVIMFIGTIILIPILIINMPADYFTREKKSVCHGRHPFMCMLVLFVKNLLGAVFVLVGILLLVMPGQGLLSIVVGILLLNYPGKYQFERWLISRRKVMNALNWIRLKMHHPPLEQVTVKPYHSSGSP